MNNQMRNRNELAWDSALERVMEKLQEVGAEVTPEQSEKITGRLYNLALHLTQTHRKDSPVFTSIKEFISRVPPNEIFLSSSLAKRTTDLETSDVAYFLRKNSLKLGILRASPGPYWQGRQMFWFKPTEEKFAPIQELKRGEEAKRNFLVDAITRYGYCESPSILSKSNFQTLYNTWTGRPITREDNLNIRQGYDPAEFLHWIKEGQPVFDAFIEETHLPTARLNGEIAVVYHPEQLKAFNSLL